MCGGRRITRPCLKFKVAAPPPILGCRWRHLWWRGGSGSRSRSWPFCFCSGACSAETGTDRSKSAREQHQREQHQRERGATPRQLLVDELTPLKMSELRKRAVGISGIDPEAIEEARDDENPRAALIKLVVAHAPDLQESDELSRERARGELAELKMPELRRRAASAGIEVGAIEVVRDDPNPRSTLVELIMGSRMLTGREDAAREEGSRLHEVARLHEVQQRALLSRLKMSELRKRAAGVGIDAEALNEAMDEDDPRRAFTALLVTAAEHARRQAAAEQASQQASQQTKVTAELAAAEREAGWQAALRAEVAPLKFSVLRKRALSVSSADAIEEAEDEDQPKVALVELIVAAHSPMTKTTTALGQELSELEAGGGKAAAFIGPCLDHAVEVLDSLSTTLPRHERKAAMELLDRVEAAAESADGEWCNGLKACNRVEIERLGSSLACVKKLVVGDTYEMGASSSVMVVVAALLECLERCENAVLRSVSVLSSSENALFDRKVSELCRDHGLSSASADDQHLPAGVDRLCAVDFGDELRVDSVLNRLEEAVTVAAACADLDRKGRRELWSRLSSLISDLESDESMLHGCVSSGWQADHVACVAVVSSCERMDGAAAGVGLDDVRSLAEALERLPAVLKSREDQIAEVLLGGGEEAAGLLTGVLEHAMDAVDKLMISTPRRSRQAVSALLEQLTEVAESVDRALCTELSRCDEVSMSAIGEAVSAVEAAEPDMGAVQALLETVRHATDPVRTAAATLQLVDSPVHSVDT